MYCIVITYFSLRNTPYLRVIIYISKVNDKIRENNLPNERFISV